MFYKNEAKIPPRDVMAPALGYNGNAQYIGLFWDDNKFTWDDGERTHYGGNERGFLTLISHLLDMLPINTEILGSPTRAASHMLIIDLQNETVQIWRFNEGVSFLSQQPPQGEYKKEFQFEDLADVIEASNSELRRFLESQDTSEDAVKDAVRKMDNWFIARKLCLN